MGYLNTAATILLASAAPALAQDAAPLQADPSAPEIVDGATDRYDRMTVPVTIEGQGPFRFMIDTGAQATVVTRGLRDRLALPSLGRATLVGMAASRDVEVVQLDGLEFAARVFDAIHAPLLEAQHIGADGILGLDSLQNLRVLIDFRAQSIAVDDARDLGGNDGYEIIVRARRKLGRLIITDALVDGVRTSVIIDTGAQGSMGNLALQRRLRTRHATEVTTTDVTGATITSPLGFARTVEIGRMRLSGLGIAYSDAPAFAALGLAHKPAMVLGITDLRSFDRVAIDFAERTVLFDLPPGSERWPGQS
ncbi:aspartyl protease family protein [Tsuneonella rigui]|uniref:aspartyl protease family protein n=1 Tax=Tsuneonella rigui TaxID=1708790 RepID=UPI000F7E98E9|nr:aspartyl protease family protein [Tsuneonella rigui]